MTIEHGGEIYAEGVKYTYHLSGWGKLGKTPLSTFKDCKRGFRGVNSAVDEVGMFISITEKPAIKGGVKDTP